MAWRLLCGRLSLAGRYRSTDTADTPSESLVAWGRAQYVWYRRICPLVQAAECRTLPECECRVRIGNRSTQLAGVLQWDRRKRVRGDARTQRQSEAVRGPLVGHWK